MSDARLRDLERRARAGDLDAVAAHARAVERTLRDPRIDPRVGDVVVVTTPTGRQHARRVEEIHGSGTSLYVAWIDEDGFSLSDVAMHIGSWRRWACRGDRSMVAVRAPEEP